MTDYNELKSRYETIKEFCRLYRNELTRGLAISIESAGLASSSDYMKFMNDLSEDAFAARYLDIIMWDYSFEYFEEILNGEKSFDEFYSDVFPGVSTFIGLLTD